MWGGGGGRGNEEIESPQASCGEWAAGGWSQLFWAGRRAQSGGPGRGMWAAGGRVVRLLLLGGPSASEQACFPLAPYESCLLVGAADQPAGSILQGLQGAFRKSFPHRKPRVNRAGLRVQWEWWVGIHKGWAIKD